VGGVFCICEVSGVCNCEVLDRGGFCESITVTVNAVSATISQNT
jgi:hypothetical protein